jgi:alkylation response protein AidB-like acyl-CoA dehydrogenase
VSDRTALSSRTATSSVDAWRDLRGHSRGCLGRTRRACQYRQAAAAGPVPMRDSETLQGEMGRIAAEVRAARAFLQVQAASHWCHALAGTLKDEALRTQGTQTAIWLAATCVRATDACFALGGSSALFDASPLQRRLRDLHVAVQHNAAQQRHYVSAGKLLLDSSVVSSKFIGDSRANVHIGWVE